MPSGGSSSQPGSIFQIKFTERPWNTTFFLKKRPRYRCAIFIHSPANFADFLRTLILQNTHERLLLKLLDYYPFIRRWKIFLRNRSSRTGAFFYICCKISINSHENTRTGVSLSITLQAVVLIRWRSDILKIILTIISPKVRFFLKICWGSFI